ncbi:uncharacterized protein IRX2-DT isoform X1 [Pan paniscus]|uniref:uncharacterized protein IRX2-DT isoform X1 n=1 Tax=Pan paniscus TaxID=9597 RepID=UPI00155FECE3
MVAPAARVFLRAVRAALTSTVPDLLCLLARGSPRGLASGRLPLAVHSAQHGPGSGAPWLRSARRALRFVLSKHWGDDCYLTNRLWQDLKPPSHVENGQELRLAPPVQWALQPKNLERVYVDTQVSASGDFLRGRARGTAGPGGSGSGSPRERGRLRRPGRSPGAAPSSVPPGRKEATQARSRARGRRGGAVARVCRPESQQRWARPTSSHGGLIRGRRKNGIEAFQ